ncbi:hypothetical protein NDU88_003350 [Pleurodeles waltl]|uniref:Uncharacterized protein n=1 Tax=Pleurodeles waltl TaxID=8319 RepID=A0AAV7TNE6_PLEWA|nr:hypothetical protein NDU88_003350 [Pleurodeles waltl]
MNRHLLSALERETFLQLPARPSQHKHTMCQSNVQRREGEGGALRGKVLSLSQAFHRTDECASVLKCSRIKMDSSSGGLDAFRRVQSAQSKTETAAVTSSGSAVFNRFLIALESTGERDSRQHTK